MNLQKTSKFLSLILRHKPETIGIELDANGWVQVDVLLDALKASGHALSREQLEAVVRDNDKQRFMISDGRIRANQGHSLNVELDLEKVAPPRILFHGTTLAFLDRIKSEGLRKMSRHHVHLSADPDTARRVGSRHGKPIILEVNSSAMTIDGFEFYLSQNGVWLVDHVPWQYITAS